MKKPVQLKYELFIIFNTFYLFLIDESVTYFANQRMFSHFFNSNQLDFFAIQTDYYFVLTRNQIK